MNATLYLRETKLITSALNSALAKPLVSLRFKKVEEVNHLLLNIQSKALPVSWFITSSEGSVILSGHSSLTNDLINIDSLESGHYYLRAAGEKLHFEIY